MERLPRLQHMAARLPAVQGTIQRNMMDIPGGNPTTTAAARLAFSAWVERSRKEGKAAPNWEDIAPATRAAWIASQQLAAETVTIALLTDLALWADVQGDLGAALARAVWRYASEELKYEPQEME